MFTLASGIRKLACFSILACLAGMAQEIPDAPTPKATPQPENPFPADSAPAPKNTHAAQDAPPNAPAETPSPVPPTQTARAAGPGDPGPDFTLFHNINFVQIPVTVKDRSGRLVPGLAPRDFTVFEDGVAQKLSFFTSDPIALSVAILVDTNMPSDTLKKIYETLPGLLGAFSQFDEVSLYRYGNTVQQMSGFSTATEIPLASLQQKIKRSSKENAGPVMGGGPMSAPQGSINGTSPTDPGASQTYTPEPQQPHVLNDAVLSAAQELGRRERTRRRIIFLISDGREYGSSAHFDEVRKVLLSRDVTLYALGVDTAAIPIYDQVNRVRLPGFGYGNILPKYASATGGETFTEFNRQSIEQAYTRITDVARNQYTLGYNTKTTAASTYRSIDVHVHRADLVVIAKSGYYPLPPQRH